jgi:hypothetical protein
MSMEAKPQESDPIADVFLARRMANRPLHIAPDHLLATVLCIMRMVGVEIRGTMDPFPVALVEL